MISKETREQIQNLLKQGEAESNTENKCFSSQEEREQYYIGWKSALETLKQKLGEIEAKELEEMEKEVGK